MYLRQRLLRQVNALGASNWMPPLLRLSRLHCVCVRFVRCVFLLSTAFSFLLLSLLYVCVMWQDDVVTMQLSYFQIMAKLRKVGIILETRQARNIRYRLVKGLPVGPKDALATPDSMESDLELDALFNDELARELEAGGRESVESLLRLHKELEKTRAGYKFDVSQDDLGRFTATCWMTGRQRVRAARDGILLFLDSSRSGINTVSYIALRCSAMF